MREVSAEMWVGGLAPVADGVDLGDGVELTREPGEAWLGRYQRKGASEVALKVLTAGPSVWFATVPGEGGEPDAIGRCVVDGRWAGFAAVEVAPSRRRQGLASAVMTALAARTGGGRVGGLAPGGGGQRGAQALYGRLGFAAHHAYHHYRAPEPHPDPDRDPNPAGH